VSLQSQPLLYPAPQSVTWGTGRLRLSLGGAIHLAEGATGASIAIATTRLVQALTARAGGEWVVQAGAPHPDRCTIRVAVRPWGDDSTPEAYSIEIDARGITITGHDIAGAFYGLQTLYQVVAGSPDGSVPQGRVYDHPTISRRGVMLDVSRDRVPTIETLRLQIDEFAALKYNELQLYMEHTFAYSGHEEVWGDESPFTAAEILELDRYCRDRHIELVPNQNALGHMHKWLENPAYAHLAENHPYRPVEVAEHVMHRGAPFWGHVPYSISPTDPQAVDLVLSLLDELLPNFTSTTVNIGLDEPFDLATGRSRDAGDPVEIYLSHVHRLYDHLVQQGRTVQMWGDFVADHPESAHRLPDDIVVVDWGYWSSYPFDERAANLARAGRRFYLATGTNAWCSIGGRTDETRAHMFAATDAAIAHGADGILVTDWGWFRYGTLQQHPVSYFGFLLAAGESWSPMQSRQVDIADALSSVVFADAGGVIGAIMVELGEICPGGGRAIVDNSPLYWALREDLGWIREHTTLSMAEVEDALSTLAELDARLSGVSLDRDDAAAIVSEVRLTIRMLRHGALRTIAALTDNDLRRASAIADLASDLPGLLGQFATTWLGRYRTGGLAGTLSSLHALEREYGAGEVLT